MINTRKSFKLTPTDKNKRIKELEKENAELKQKLEALEGQTPWKDIKDKSEVIGKLTKAKELLNGCIFKARGNVSPSWSELVNDIEQFLREIEK